MKIVVMGAGAIGSFFGGLLSKENDVVLVGRKPHVDRINKEGLRITGKTNMKKKLEAVSSVDEIVDRDFDLILLTVKAYDTVGAAKMVKPLLSEKTVFMSLQNGLDNIEKISKTIDKKKLVVGSTTYGAFFVKPGIIKNTGLGEIAIGELNGKETNRIEKLGGVFERVGFNTVFSGNIHSKIWEKGVINSSINPITALLKCKNGYLLNNQFLEDLVEKTCVESVCVACSVGMDFREEELIEKTKQVIRDTSDNFSSMVQSLDKGKKTEVDSINGKIVEVGGKNKVPTPLNECLFSLIKSL